MLAFVDRFCEVDTGESPGDGPLEPRIGAVDGDSGLENRVSEEHAKDPLSVRGILDGGLREVVVQAVDQATYGRAKAVKAMVVNQRLYLVSFH